MIFVLVGISAHPVWIGLILAFVFGYKLGLDADHGVLRLLQPERSAPSAAGPAQWAYHLILPWCTFALLFAALYVRLIRANVMETMSEDYVRTARAKGAPPRPGDAVAHPAQQHAAGRHDPRHGHRPRARRRDLHRVDLRPARARAVVIVAYEKSDLPVIVGVVVFSTIVIIIFNLIVDCLYAVVDPRIRLT